MAILIVAILSLVLDTLTYIPVLNWFSLIGFAFGIAAWVMGRKMLQTNTSDKIARPAMILGIIGTFAGLTGIILSFVIGSVLYSTFVVF
ncbi:hypothetical protein LJC56_04935 [Christensenellaceae bacterium OttesenSCG-928-K19]|nr:hypothetical protein [Christensenellaceae bacterium OttesenSCG-928-K19]